MNKNIDTLKKKLEKDPDNSELLKELGNEYYFLNNFDTAIKYYIEAIKKDKNFFKAYYNIGNTYYKQQKIDDAINSWYMAVKINPNHEKSHFNLGFAFFDHKKNTDKAIKHLEKAHLINPENSGTLNQLALCMMEKERFEDAEALLLKAIEKEKNTSEYFYNLGNIYYEMKEFDKAIDNYSKTLEIDLNDDKAMNNIADCLLKKGNYEKALEYAQKAINTNPDFTAAYCTRGEINLSMEKIEDCKNDFEHVIKIDGDRTMLSQYAKSILKDIEIRGKNDKK